MHVLLGQDFLEKNPWLQKICFWGPIINFSYKIFTNIKYFITFQIWLKAKQESKKFVFFLDDIGFKSKIYWPRNLNDPREFLSSLFKVILRRSSERPPANVSKLILHLIPQPWDLIIINPQIYLMKINVIHRIWIWRFTLLNPLFSISRRTSPSPGGNRAQRSRIGKHVIRIIFLRPQAVKNIGRFLAVSHRIRVKMSRRFIIRIFIIKNRVGSGHPRSAHGTSISSS